MPEHDSQRKEMEGEIETKNRLRKIETERDGSRMFGIPEKHEGQDCRSVSVAKPSNE